MERLRQRSGIAVLCLVFAGVGLFMSWRKVTEPVDVPVAEVLPAGLGSLFRVSVGPTISCGNGWSKNEPKVTDPGLAQTIADLGASAMNAICSNKRADARHAAGTWFVGSLLLGIVGLILLKPWTLFDRPELNPTAPPPPRPSPPSQPASPTAPGSPTAQPPAARAQGTPGAWHPDPWHRYPQRWWDGGQWTDVVNDGAGMAVDPPGKR